MKGSNQVSRGCRTSVGTTEHSKPRDALWVVFDHRLVLPEYIVEFDLLPTNMNTPKTSTCDKSDPSSMLSAAAQDKVGLQTYSEPHNVGAGEGATAEHGMNGVSGQQDHAALAEPAARNDLHDNTLWKEKASCIGEENSAFSYDTVASVAAVQRQAPEVARHCRELGGFLVASEHVGSDTVTSALVPLPFKVRQMAEAALAMPPLV